MKEAYNTYYDNRHGAYVLPMLKPDDMVLIKTEDDRKWRSYGRVLGPADSRHWSYLIESPQGVI